MPQYGERSMPQTKNIFHMAKKKAAKKSSKKKASGKKKRI
jgi:hypothetical protein